MHEILVSDISMWIWGDVFSKICASWMTVWNISANHVLVPLKFNLNWNIWKPLKCSPLDFRGQRLGNTKLVVFLRFHSISLVVKWPDFVRVYITNILRCCNVKLAQWTEVRSFFSRSWVHSRSGFLCYDVRVTHVACILSSKPNNFGKDSLIQNYQNDLFDGLCALGTIESRTFDLTIERGDHLTIWYSTTFVKTLRNNKLYLKFDGFSTPVICTRDLGHIRLITFHRQSEKVEMGGSCLGEQKSIQQIVVFNSCKLYYYT